MPRTSAPATPGEAPKTTDDHALHQLAGDALEAGAQAEKEVDDKQAQLDKQAREIADLRSLVHQLGRNQAATVLPEQVELPELADIEKDKPKVPVLTKGGWYVPPVLINAGGRS